MEGSVGAERVVREQGVVLVRRFTESLDASDTLSVGTQVAQTAHDAEIDARDKLRARLHFNEFDRSTRPFERCDAMRQALQKASDKFFQSWETPKEKRFLVFRKSFKKADTQAEQRVRQGAVDSFEGVKDMVLSIAEEWRNKHSKVTVNHAEIADGLVAATAHLCDRVVVCTEILEVVQRESLQRQLADVYEALFSFLLEAAKWFNDPKFSRFFDSFNKRMKEKHANAVSVINQSIDIIIERGSVEELARVEYTRRTADIIEWKLDNLSEVVVPAVAEMRTMVDEVRMGCAVFSADNLRQLGETMVSLLLNGAEDGLRKVFKQELYKVRLASDGLIDNGTTGGTITSLLPDPAADLIYRNEADDRLQFLKAMTHVLVRVGKWMQASPGDARMLWVQHQFEYEEHNAAKATALGVISVAAKANAPFVSYICRKLHVADVPAGQTQEGSGLLSLVYCVALQLLRFRPRNDGFCILPALVEQLGETMESWDKALELLRLLLEGTPVLRYCIIHGLNSLENGSDGGKCAEVLQVLRAAAGRQDSPLNVLLTTSGHSRVLSEATDLSERVISRGALQTLLVFTAPLLVSALPVKQEAAEPWLNIAQEWAQHFINIASADSLGERSPWQKWLLAESIRRTIVMAYVLICCFNAWKYGYCSNWLLLESLPFDSRPGLWMAESPQAWIAAAGSGTGRNVGTELTSVHEFGGKMKTIDSTFCGDRFLSMIAMAHNGSTAPRTESSI
ncbi:hypothetical protein N0V90_012404 [Kalmusia sp. IMI 367209]|nr:hypothetical protein N0V90_012404 [Kalmusia sp. IMI 367209]